MKIRIYQINMDRDAKRIAFVGLDRLEKYQGSAEIDSALYYKVFEGEVDCASLEAVYQMFNLNHPEGYTGRSLSVSDVVEINNDAGGSMFHFCDSIGFKSIAFRPELTGTKEKSGNKEDMQERSLELLKRLMDEMYRLRALDDLNHSDGSDYDGPRLHTAIRALRRKIDNEQRKFKKKELAEYFDCPEILFW